MEKRIDLLNSGSAYLAKGSSQNALLESEIMLSYILGAPRLNLYLDNLSVGKKEQRRFYRMLGARRKGYPLQYLTGTTEFMGLKFVVRRPVFIPRPETEILVETAVNIVSQSACEPVSRRYILDIGTGCGNIAVSLAKSIKKAYIFACDICQSALQLAKENARLNQADIALIRSDLFSAFGKKGLFSLIVSNPPYIRTGQIQSLPCELHYEPSLALDGGADGLLYYRRIIHQAADFLKDDGFLALEIGDDQADAVIEIISNYKQLVLVKRIQDYNRIDRVIVVQKRDA